MRPEFLLAIEALKEEVVTLENKVSQTKAAANRMCEVAGIGLAFPEPPAAKPSHDTFVIRDGQFLGRPLAAAAREFLEARRAAGLGPASPREIHDGLVSGGFRFGAKTSVIAITSVRTALRKNLLLFHRVESGDYEALASTHIAPTVEPPEEKGTTAKARSHSKRASRRPSKSAAAKKLRQAANKELAAFILSSLESGEPRDVDYLKQAAIRNGRLGVEPATQLNRFQGLLLSLNRQKKVKPADPGKWVIVRANGPTPTNGNIHPIKGAA